MTGLWNMIRLILRRDRLKLPLSIGGFTITTLAMIPLLRNVYANSETLSMMYATLNSNPAIRFMAGSMDAPDLGSLVTIELLIWFGLALAFINTLFIVRHTRHNEEIGAQELLLSGRAHRMSGLAAALIVAFGMNSLITLSLGVGLSLVDVTWGIDQSWLFAIAMGGFGFVWAAISAIVVQLVESGRSANSILAGLIGVGFILRGIGDFSAKLDDKGLLQPSWVSNLSPFGWLQATRPLTESNWQPLLISLIFSIVVSMLGFYLLSRRDVGAGILPSSKGKIRASRFLSTPLGLTIYLQKNIFMGWLVAILVMVITIGALVPQMADIYNSSEEMRGMIQAIGGTGELIPSFISAMLAIMSLMVYAYAIQSLLKMRNEEVRGHLESLLATRVSKVKWLWQHIAVITIGGATLLGVMGAAIALCINLLSDYSVDVWKYTVAGLAYLPILAAFMSLFLLLFEVLPRLASGITWLYFGFVAFALWLGPIIELDEKIMNFSIMEHVSTPPVEEILWWPLATITIGAIALIFTGITAFLQRDLKN